MLPEAVIGAIGLWSGTVGSIPSGWYLCDGNNGTPDLTDRFVVGAGSTYSVSDTGGSQFHNHDFTGNAHSHTLPVGIDIIGGPNLNAGTDATPVTGTSDDSDVPLTYYSLAYIMFQGV